MDSDEILATCFRISELMNVRYFGARDCTHRTFATRVVTQTSVFLVLENRLPHQAFLNFHDAVRAIVIVNGRLLAWAPADHQHLDCFIAAHSMAPVIAFLEPDVRLEIDIDDLDT